MTGIPIMIPYNFDLNAFSDISITESMYAYFLPFWYDYPLEKTDGKVFNIYFRDKYTAYINNLKQVFPINIVLFLNKEDLIEDEVLSKYYIDYLKITKFIIKNDRQYHQIKRYLKEADIFYFDKDFVYNINDINQWDKCFFPIEISSASSRAEITNFLGKLNLQPMQDWKVNMKQIKVLIDATYGNNEWEETAQNLYDECPKSISVFGGGPITSYKKVSVPWLENKNDYYYLRNFNVGFIKNIPLYISRKAGIDPISFKEEYVDIVKKFNIRPRVYIDRECSFILPFDKTIDKALKSDECDMCEGIKSWTLRQNYPEFNYKINDFLENPEAYNSLAEGWAEKVKELYNISEIQLEDNFYEVKESLDFLISTSEIITFEILYENLDYETFIFEPICGLYKNELAGIKTAEEMLLNYNDYDLSVSYFIDKSNNDVEKIKEKCEEDFNMATLNWRKDYAITEGKRKNYYVPEGNDYIEFIIPYYNTTESIQNCIAQNIKYLLENSSHKPHFILVCNGSNDEDIIKEKTKEWNEYILYLNTIEQSGADGARNMGIEYATGKRLIFWDADDLVTDKYLADELYEIDPSADLIYMKLYIKLFKTENFTEDTNHEDMFRVCVSKQLIDKYNWRYPKVYKEEDTGFYRMLDSTAKKESYFPGYVGIYNYAINVSDDCNLCASGPQDYGEENAILTNICAQKAIIEKGFSLNNMNLVQNGFDQMINDYEFWQNHDNHKNYAIYPYTLNLLCRLYGMNPIVDEEVSEEEIKDIFNKMVENNHRNQKTIDLYKKEFNIEW